MPSTSALASAILLAASTVSALPEISIGKRDRHTNGRTNSVARAMLKRDAQGDGWLETNVFNVATWSTGGAYYANVSVGSPPQPQTVILDTGSSDLYFDASSAEECSLPESDPYSCQGGTFDRSASGSYKVVEPAPAFNSTFGDGSTVSGPFARDTVCVGDVCINNVQFGLAENVNVTTGFSIGLMGIGYSANEGVTNHFYPNIPEVLVDSGVINSRLYSVYLNEVEDVSGSILFGGIDTSKYTGDLVTVNMLPDYNLLQQNYELVYQFVTVITGITATVNGNEHNIFSNGATGIDAYTAGTSLPVLLDTGSAAWSVPSRFYNEYLAPVFSYVDEQGLCSCSHATSGDKVSLEFDGAITIEVAASEFIVPLYNSTTQQPYTYNEQGDEACVFLISPAEDLGTGFQTLGDAILHSMYVVYDLDQGQLSIAQANSDQSASPNVKVVSAGPGGVASAVSLASTPNATPYRVAPLVSATVDFSASTMSSTIGLATGINAVPTEARPSGSAGGSGGSGSGSSSGSSTSSSGVATGLNVPSFDWTRVSVLGITVAAVAVGMGIML